MLHRRLGVAQFALCCQRCCISAVWLGVITLHVFTHIYWRQTRFFLYSLWKAFCPYMVFITSTVYPFTCVIDSFLFISALCFLFKPVKLFIWCILTLVIMIESMSQFCNHGNLPLGFSCSQAFKYLFVSIGCPFMERVLVNCSSKVLHVKKMLFID